MHLHIACQYSWMLKPYIAEAVRRDMLVCWVKPKVMFSVYGLCPVRLQSTLTRTECVDAFF
jgi:hypothetical protein